MINGQNIIACEYVEINGGGFYATDPSTGNTLEERFALADDQSVTLALNSATEAFKIYGNLPGKNKARFLRAISDEIGLIADLLIARAVSESGLPEGRIKGELGRTTNQLGMFADLLEEGSWVEAVIDEANPTRLPLPKPDIRRMMVPLGPVAVFGASNFPLAFSVAGGDTASALASGCPVIVKAHPSHAGTSALVGSAICKAAISTEMPKGVFSLLFDKDYNVGEQLIKNELTKSVSFTGSFKGGMALIKLAQERHTPIPVFTEMGSINPVVLLPSKLKASHLELATKLAASITLGVGQFCTKPGIILGIRSEELDSFIQELANAIIPIPADTMLNAGIWSNYESLSKSISKEDDIELIAQASHANQPNINQAPARVARVKAEAFISNPRFREEIFGPWSLVVVAEDLAELQKAIEILEGQLTATIMAENKELRQYKDLVSALSAICGRLLLNGVPTGVEVCAAMQHGGPFPASSDSRFTSVGTGAVYRFVRPMAWQDWPDELLPPALKAENPLQIWRQVNNKWTK